MKKAKKNDVTRRLGRAGSPNWHAMLDAAEETLQDQGVRQLTAARVAERLGIKRRLVFYYFQNRDDLLVETFRRLSVRELERLRTALDAERPLREIWNVCIRTLDPRLISEFMALANRVPELREEVSYFIEESRRLQVEALTRALSRDPTLSPLTPSTLAIFGTSLALTLLREGELGIDAGHADVMDMVAEFLAAAEPDQPAAERERIGADNRH